MQRAALACFGVLGTGGLLLLAGCPANLEDPGRFDIQVSAGGSSAGANTGGGSSTAGAPPVVDTACLTALFNSTCTLCHFAGTTIGGGLDLKSANVASRLVNISAMHMSVATTATCPTVKLVDTANPSASWLLAKITAMQGTCGESMPIGGTLTTDQIACVNTFVTAEAAGSGTAAGAGTGSAGSSGASAASGGGTSAGTGGT